MLRLTLAALHLLALGIGLGAVIFRGSALRETPLTATSLKRAFSTDSLWGLAAILWIGSGLWRLFGSTEKSTTYYLHNHIFFAKMGLLVLILILEVWPAATLVRWRRKQARGDAIETFALPETAQRIATISHIQALLVVAMVFAAVAMARGYGAT